MIKVGIIGGTGYTGEILIGLLLKHAQVEITWVTSESYANKPIKEVYPHLNGKTDLVCKKLELAKLSMNIDVVFIALPHGLAMDLVPHFLKQGIKVIDLGADYRIKKQATYEKWYGLKHKNAHLLEKAVYGLPELHHAKIQEAKLIANPGCYATATELALLPLVKNHLIDKHDVIVDAKSGVSGAGRSLSLTSHYTECNEGVSAYKVANHRHTPEIEQEVGLPITFVPHLMPMTRGILATVYVKLKRKGEVAKYYKEFYENAPFVRILEKTLPSTKYVYGSNYCDLAFVRDDKNERLIIISAIDNLIKGASGQAVQNMNIMFGLDETAGLDAIGMYP